MGAPVVKAIGPSVVEISDGVFESVVVRCSLGDPGSLMSQHLVGRFVDLQCPSCATVHFGECSRQDREH